MLKILLQHRRNQLSGRRIVVVSKIRDSLRRGNPTLFAHEAVNQTFPLADHVQCFNRSRKVNGEVFYFSNEVDPVSLDEVVLKQGTNTFLYVICPILDFPVMWHPLLDPGPERQRRVRLNMTVIFVPRDAAVVRISGKTKDKQIS